MRINCPIPWVPWRLDLFVFALVGLRGETHTNRRPPRSSFHPPRWTVVANSGGGLKGDSAPPSGGVGSPRWRAQMEELIEVSSPEENPARNSPRTKPEPD